MPQVSKYPVSEEVYLRVFDVFLKSISKLRSKDQVENFFQEFLTPTEQVMLAKRLAIAFLVAKNYDYRQIAKILRVSTGTIRGVSHSYNSKGAFKKLVDNVIKDEEIEKFFENVGEKVTKMLAIPSSKTGTWVYLKQEIEKKKRKRVF